VRNNGQHKYETQEEDSSRRTRGDKEGGKKEKTGMLRGQKETEENWGKRRHRRVKRNTQNKSKRESERGGKIEGDNRDGGEQKREGKKR